MSSLSCLRTFLSLAILALFPSAEVLHGAVFYLQVSQSVSGNTWTSTADWNSMPDGSGSAPAGADFNNAANQFDTQGFVLRTTNSNSAFGNATLTLSAGSGNGLIARSTGSGNTIANLVTLGGRITAGASPAVLNITSFTNTSGVSLKPEDFGNPRTLTLNIGTLTGAGDFTLISTASSSPANVNFNVTGSAASYTGSILFGGSQAVNLNFGSSFVSGGSLVLTDSFSRITLNQDVTFASLSINSVSLAADTYTWAELNTIAPTIFNTAGVGSITVVPEPGAMPLMLLAAGGVCLARRRASLK